jgi:hypothetical protein
VYVEILAKLGHRKARPEGKGEPRDLQDDQ